MVVFVGNSNFFFSEGGKENKAKKNVNIKDRTLTILSFSTLKFQFPMVQKLMKGVWL